MRIVHIAEWNAKSGGGFTAASNLVNSLLKIDQKMDIHIVSFSNKSITIKENGYTLHLLKLEKFPTSQYWYLPKILNDKILKIRPDIVHLHFTYPPYSFVTHLNIPVIITVHGLSSVRVKGSYPKSDYLNLKFILYPYFEKKALRNASRVITVSQWAKEESDKLIGVDSKTVYIPNGVNYKKYCNIEPMQISHPSIFFIGRLVKFKGVDILIKSLQIVKKVYPDIHLYIAGNGPQSRNLKSLSRDLNLDSSITFLSFLSEEDKLKMLKSADIFVVPSRIETFGIVILEALASGIPIVASNTGGIPQILDNGKYGLLAETENSEDLAQKIIALIKNKSLRDELSEKGKQRAKEYSWDNVAFRTTELYSSILKFF